MTIKATERRLEKAQMCMLRRRFISLIFLIVLIVLMIVILFNHAFGWFFITNDLHAEHMEITTDFDTFEVAVSGGQVSPYAIDSPLAAYLRTNEGIEKANSTDITNGPVSILCNFVNENPYEEGSADIGPGSYGVISFDIVAKGSYSGSFNITLDTLAYGISGGSPQAVAAADEDVLYPLISGHILLFESRGSRASGGYYYYDRIEDDRLFYDVSDHSPTVLSDGRHYTVNIYWIWPATFAQFALAEDNPKLHLNSVFHSESERLDMLDYISDNRSRFFRNLSPAVDFTASGFEDTYFVELSDGYNNGDQFIGEKSHFVILRATVTGE